MVEIVYKPLKELVIGDYTYYPKPETLASQLGIMVATGQPTALLWAEGVVFVPMPILPETEWMAQEYLRGRVYWSSVMFALMPTFQSPVRAGVLEVPVIDVSLNSMMKEVAQWLKGKAPEPL